MKTAEEKSNSRKAYMKMYREKHPEYVEKARKYARKYYAEHREKICKQNADWRIRNRERWLKIDRESVAKWRKANPDKIRAYEYKYYHEVLKPKRLQEKNN